MKFKIDYIKILKDSFVIVWKKKILLVFGLLIAIGNVNGFYSNSQEKNDVDIRFEEIVSGNMTLIYLALSLFIVIVIILIALKVISEAAIIKFAGLTLYSEKMGFRELFKEGKKYALKLILIDVILVVSVLVLLLTLAVPIIFLFSMKIYPLAIVMGLLALFLLIPVFAIVYYIREYSYVFAVISDTSVKYSIEKGYQTFKDNIISSLVFSLILLMITFLSIVFLLTFLLPVAIVIGIPGIIASIAFSKGVGVVFLIVGVIIFIVALIIMQSFLRTYCLVAWVLFVKELVGIRSIESENSVETEVAITPQVSEV